MSSNYGKKWEQKFKEDFCKIDGAMLTRLYDTTNGFKSISNISDFIGYVYPFIFYLECKSTLGNTFPLSRLTQKDKLLTTINKKGVNAGIILWFIDHGKVCYVPIEEIDRLDKSGYKSINYKMIEDSEFNVYNIPSIKKRVFLDCDYSMLITIAQSKLNIAN